MGIYRHFPYSNFHEMNMDELIKILLDMQDEWNETKEEWATYKDYIDNYFNTLDLSEETYNALLRMIENGVFNDTVDPVIINEVENWLNENINEGFVVDKSLTISGAAADAKITGNKLNFISTHKVNQPLDEHNQPINGLPNQILRTKGDGKTEWVTYGIPTDEQTQQAVSEWLENHPEATTTVEDGSLTIDKFTDTLKLQTVNDYVIPEMFGAAGDGITDDYTAIQYALNNFSRVKLCDNKTYAISEALIMTDNTEFFGGINSVLYNTNPIGIRKQCLIVGYIGSGTQKDAPNTLTSYNCTISGNTITGSFPNDISVNDIVLIHGDTTLPNRNDNYANFQIERIIEITESGFVTEHDIEVDLDVEKVSFMIGFTPGIDEDPDITSYIAKDCYIHDLTLKTTPDNTSSWYTIFNCGYNCKFENLEYLNTPACFGSNFSAYSEYCNITGETYDSFADMPEYQFRNYFADWEIEKGTHLVNQVMFTNTQSYGGKYERMILKTNESASNPIFSISESRNIVVKDCEFYGNDLGVTVPVITNSTSLFINNIFDCGSNAFNITSLANGAKIINNYCKGGALLFSTTVHNDELESKNIIVENNVIEQRPEINSGGGMYFTGTSVNIFSEHINPKAGDCIEIQFYLAQTRSVVFDIALNSDTFTITTPSQPAGIATVYIIFTSNSNFRLFFKSTDNVITTELKTFTDTNNIKTISIDISNTDTSLNMNGYIVLTKYNVDQTGIM